MPRPDPNFPAFHKGQSTTLPEFDRHASERIPGRYIELLSHADLSPVMLTEKR